ncbi:MAG: hypothetical protein ABJG04_22705 [Roseobacter sp.]
MDNEITLSLSRVVLHAIRHCCVKRLANYHHLELPKEFYDEVGSEMVDLFELRLSQWNFETPPAVKGTSSGWKCAKAAQQRGRD